MVEELADLSIVTIPPVVILLLVYPLGCLWAKIMPTKTFTTFGVPWSLNTGPFNIKEHAGKASLR